MLRAMMDIVAWMDHVESSRMTIVCGQVLGGLLDLG